MDARVDEPDRGDPNVFTLYRGRYSVTALPGAVVDNTAVMRTQTNEVQLLGNVQVTGYTGGAVMVLPEECRPAQACAYPCSIMVDGQYTVCSISVNPDGNVSVATAETDFMLMTRGLNFNIGGNIYIDKGV